MVSGEVTVALPSGTVTFLFTDIEGSTRRWEADPGAMRTMLAAHDAVLRAAIEAHGGQVFKHTGDGMCAAFDRAQAAVDAAIDAQRRLALPVRMGLTSGEVEAQGGDYFGPTLNLAARVMSAGHGGQILVAASTIELVDAQGAKLGENDDWRQARNAVAIEGSGAALRCQREEGLHDACERPALALVA